MSRPRQPVIRVQVRYSGRVQGVGFRATCVWIAQTVVDTADPITGWVRNEADGDVTLEAQGSPAAVEGFLNEVAERLARNIVSAVRAETAVVEGERGFGIQR